MFRAHLHRSSVVVGIVIAMVLVLLCVPGRIYDWDPGLSAKHAHGWPFVCLRREVYLGSITGTAPVISKTYQESLDLLPMAGVPWLSVANWRFWESRDLLNNPRREFNPFALAADAAVAALLVAAIVMLFEFRRRRRSSVFSFSLMDGFVGLTLACCAFGWFAWLRNSFQQEVAAQAAFEDEESPGSCEQLCIAPE